MKLNAAQLKSFSRQVAQSPNELATKRFSDLKRNGIYIILDNVLDTYNIGSIFRLADAVSAKKIYICGESEIPPNHRIKKASINTTEWVDWEYSETVLEAVSRVKREAERVKIIAVEQTPVESGQSKKSVQYDKFEYMLPICLIVGHETYGVSKEVLDLVDGIVELPMFGVNISLNVVVSLAIVLYKVIEKTQ